MQGVVQAYDPSTGHGTVLAEPDRTPIALRPGALHGSIFRELRPGQRIIFDVVEEDGAAYAVRVRIGADGY
ncbi:MAG: cold-shock protein [Acidimicrobiia bacterium]|nr:cold-shock protein [Acidimicrobiia bacterium]